MSTVLPVQPSHVMNRKAHCAAEKNAFLEGQPTVQKAILPGLYALLKG